MFRERQFRWLLRLLPASFREEHERELLLVWKDETVDAARDGRRGVWAAALKDTLLNSKSFSARLQPSPPSQV